MKRAKRRKLIHEPERYSYPRLKESLLIDFYKGASGARCIRQLDLNPQFTIFQSLSNQKARSISHQVLLICLVSRLTPHDVTVWPPPPEQDSHSPGLRPHIRLHLPSPNTTQKPHPTIHPWLPSHKSRVASSKYALPFQILTPNAHPKPTNIPTPVRHFRASGYGILAPDCLGYGQTSKPLTASSYIGSSMAADIISILDHLEISSVIGIAHDWGTYLLSQSAIWFPERFEALVFFSVPFSPPARRLDVRRINEATKKKMGFEQFGYQVFFASEGAGKVIGANVRVPPFPIPPSLSTLFDKEH